MGDPLVSVITTSYNRARYLGWTIESVLAQDYGNFEYLVLDDRSPDGSAEVARRHEGDLRLRVVENEVNLGDYGNRNKGLRMARGKYIKFVDCDDIVYPHCVSEMVAVAEAHPRAAVVFSTHERPGLRYPVELGPRQAYRMHFAGGGVLHQGPLSALLRRDLLLEEGGFPEIYTGDVGCWLRLAARHPVVLMGGGLYWWREHRGQLSESLRSVSLRWAAHQVEGAGLHWRALVDAGCPMSEAEREVGRRRVVREYAGLVMRNLLRGRVRVVRALWSGRPFPWSEVAVAFFAGAGDRVEMGVGASDARAGDWQPWLEPDENVRNPGVSFVIMWDGGSEALRRTVAGLGRQRDCGWEIVLVSNEGEADDAEALVNRWGDVRVRVARVENGLDGWEGRNRGAARARGDLLVFPEAGDGYAPGAVGCFRWHGKRFPMAGMFVSCADDRVLMPRELAPSESYQAEGSGVLTVLEAGAGVVYRREVWAAERGFDGRSGMPGAALNLAVAAAYRVVWLRGGLVESAGGSPGLRIMRSRGAARTAGEREAIAEALGGPRCPLGVDEVRAILLELRCAPLRVVLGRWLGRRLALRLVPGMKLFPVVEVLCGGEDAYERGKYPVGNEGGG